jgi:hypothetical protein
MSVKQEDMSYWYERGKRDAKQFVRGFSSAPWPPRSDASPDEKAYYEGFTDGRGELAMEEMQKPEVIEALQAAISRQG